MIEPQGYRGRKVAVLGLARSGKTVAAALEQAGANVLAWDDAAVARETALAEGLKPVDPMSVPVTEWAALVMSPGIPLTHPKPHPAAMAARAAGVPVIGDIELLSQADLGSRLVGITGTNGKSTTTALIAHILDQGGRSVAVGGNLGTPVLSLDTLGADGIYVIEASSFQLDLIDRTRFTVAILLNVTPDHLDRHGDMAGYVAAKRRIFWRQGMDDTAIVGVDDAQSAAVAEALRQGPQRVVPLSVRGAVPRGIGVVDGLLIDDTDGDHVAVTDLRLLDRLPGDHNWQNAAAAYAACRALGVETATIIAGLRSFPGLAHRQELIAERSGVRYVNDSKATNADAAAKALGCYDRIYWIAGGKPKAGGIATLSPWFDRIVHAFLIGAASDDFAATLEGRVDYTRCGDLATAVSQAARAAGADMSGRAVVLLSPACASFDQFTSFEARGAAFRQLVHDLPAEGL